MTNAIEIQRLCYRTGGTFEIKDLDLHVPQGAIYGFLGPNGCGKTTTIRLMLGLLRPLGGRITLLGGAVPSEVASILARVGFVPEQPHLDPMLTVRETLAFHAAFYATWDRAWAERLRSQFGLPDDQLFGRLSKGQKGKLMMLLALAQRPELLVLDEPTDGLDPVVRRDVLSALLEYVSQRQATVFISSHLVHELERFCDWIGVMDGGRLIIEVPMERLKNGIKRLRIGGAPAAPDNAPFVLLAREPANGTGETWLVREWEPHMAVYFDGPEGGPSLHEVIDLDLEEGFVELLRTFRGPHA